MSTLDNITITDGRMKRALNKRVLPLVQNESTKIVQKELDNNLLRLGKITKFYPYLDQAEVKLDENNKKIMCEILHRFGGEIIDLYTPLSEKLMLDSSNNEKYIIPRVGQHVCVLNIHDNDSPHHIILGTLRDKDIAGFNPAKPGNMKVAAVGITNDFYIQFGLDGLSYKLPKKSTTEIGYFEDEMESVDFTDFNDVYTKEEVYTKTEVEELIALKIEEALQNKETCEDDTDDITS